MEIDTADPKDRVRIPEEGRKRDPSQHLFCRCWALCSVINFIVLFHTCSSSKIAITHIYR